MVIDPNIGIAVGLESGGMIGLKMQIDLKGLSPSQRAAVANLLRAFADFIVDEVQSSTAAWPEQLMEIGDLTRAGGLPYSPGRRLE